MQNVDDRSLRTTQMAERDASSWSCLTEDEMWEILNEWVVALPREDTLMLAMFLFVCFQRQLNLGTLDAAKKVVGVVEHHKRPSGGARPPL